MRSAAKPLVHVPQPPKKPFMGDTNTKPNMTNITLMRYEKNAAGCRIHTRKKAPPGAFLAMYCMNPKHLYPILRSNRNAVSMQCGRQRHPMPIPLLNGDAMIG
ncbi:MAG: hypothetical protein PHQ41_06575, partial [Candidatus Cloacimonetes bacterium]|nr:hypothetical protein [Candidatus Cloacimonadota bacterium]